MNYLALLRLAAPEVILTVVALVVLAADLLFLREVESRFRLIVGAMIAGLGCLAAAAWIVALPEDGNFMRGMLALDPLRRVVQIGILLLTILTLLLSTERDFTTHIGEYFALVLIAAVGMLLLVSSEDILLIFLSLELTSLSLYVLTAFDKRSLESSEAALKYFLFGGMSAAFTLFGLSLLYGLSGSTNLRQISAAIHGPELDPLLLLAIVMVVIGFGFKVAAAPFHLWAPDVYQGAPLPSAAFIASGSKLAGFFVLAQVMVVGFKGAEGSGAWRAFDPGWMPVMAVIAAFSMVVGNLAALVQTSVRRLLAYSAVAHAGYLLLAITSANQNALASLVYYALTYAITALGAFAVVAAVSERTGGDDIAHFAGLSRREPVLSICMAVFLLSLAGIPPLAGFFGKFYVFSAALAGPKHFGLLWLVVLALALSAVSLYYYLKVLKQIYVVEEIPTSPAKPIPIATMAVLILAAVVTVVLGSAPNLLIGFLQATVQP